MELQDKLSILGESARYDVSCSSSGVARRGKAGQTGNATLGGICHTWSEDGRCVSLLKVLMTNVCIYDCAYCQNRSSNDIPRATFTPQELVDVTINFYKRNFIEGLFLSSGILKNPDYTSERMLTVLRLLRQEHQFGGYIHTKIIPGTNAALIDQIGRLADRVSCNIELPSSGSLEALAPQKQPEHILTPMRLIQQTQLHLLEDGQGSRAKAPSFAPAGQTTQMIIGASPDTDFTILKLSKGLYNRYKLKRVYFSAFIPGGTHQLLPQKGTPVPLDREHRLYQADWLMRFYGFDAEELLDEQHQSLPMDVDPKCDWALRHPEAFPMEVNAASLEQLLRVPGIGLLSAQRIVEARRHGPLRIEHLRKLGIVMKRAQFFLTASGQFGGTLMPGHPLLRRQLAERSDVRQLSLFDPPETPGLYAASGLPLISPVAMAIPKALPTIANF